MKALILAAGLGTRLKPLTDTTPKPLISVNGLPLIFYNLSLLKFHGITEIVLNLHHLGEKIEKTLGNGEKWGFKFKYSWEKSILGTGGGIKKAESLLNSDPYLVLNGDIIVDCNLRELIHAHQSKPAVATLAVKKDPKDFGTLYVGAQNQIRGILEKPEGTGFTETFFTGIHIVSKQATAHLKPDQKSCIIRDAYIPLLKSGSAFNAYFLNGYWNDLGTPERLNEVAADLKSGKITLSYPIIDF